jgi:AcrR family transcriptional regulator
VSATTEGTAGGRVARKRGRRIQEILAVAAELFGERGYDAVSLDDVAERLDVTKGSLYHYFSGKEELGAAAIETLGAQWTARLARLVESTPGSPSDRLRALVGEQLVVAVRDYPAGLGLFLVPGDQPQGQRDAIKELRRRHDRLFRDLVEEGVASGEFVVVDVDTTLRCLHAAMTQASVWYGGLRGAARDRALETLVDTLMMLVGEVRPTQ